MLCWKIRVTYVPRCMQNCVQISPFWHCCLSQNVDAMRRPGYTSTWMSAISFAFHGACTGWFDWGTLSRKQHACSFGQLGTALLWDWQSSPPKKGRKHRLFCGIMEGAVVREMSAPQAKGEGYTRPTSARIQKYCLHWGHICVILGQLPKSTPTRQRDEIILFTVGLKEEKSKYKSSGPQPNFWMVCASLCLCQCIIYSVAKSAASAYASSCNSTWLVGYGICLPPPWHLTVGG